MKRSDTVLLLCAALLLPLTAAIAEDAAAPEQPDKTERKVTLEYELETALEYSVAAGADAESDLSPDGGSPGLELNGFAVQYSGLPDAISAGPYLRGALDFKGDWVLQESYDPVSGLPLLNAEQRHAWALEEFSYDTQLGWSAKAPKGAGRWTLYAAAVLSGSFNDYQKDIDIAGDERPLDLFTTHSVGAGLYWSQKLGDKLVLEYSPSFEFLYELDRAHPWIRARADLDFQLPFEDGRWQLSLSPRLATQWLTDLELKSRVSYYRDFGFVRLRADGAGFDWEQSILDGEGVGQQSRWYSGARLSWRGKDGSLAFGVEQTWWALNRTRVNDSRDKPFTMSLLWTVSGSDKK